MIAMALDSTLRISHQCMFCRCSADLQIQLAIDVELCSAGGATMHGLINHLGSPDLLSRHPKSLGADDYVAIWPTIIHDWLAAPQEWAMYNPRHAYLGHMHACIAYRLLHQIFIRSCWTSSATSRRLARSM